MAIQKIQVADKPTLDNIKTTTGTINTNVNSVKTTVGTVNTNVNSVKTTAGNIKTDTGNILSRLGTLGSAGNIIQMLTALTNKVATVQEKVDEVAASAGGVNFEYTLLKSSDSKLETYSPQNSGIVIASLHWNSSTSASLKIDSAHGGVIQFPENAASTRSIDTVAVGLFKAGAIIEAKGNQVIAHIFEFV